MRLSSLTVDGHSNGNIILSSDKDITMNFPLNDEEADRIRELAISIIKERRQMLVDFSEVF